MSKFEELTTQVMALPPKSRAELAELLIQSLEEPDDPEIRSGASVTRPADQVLRELREQLHAGNSVSR
jgi:hypothetical protein